MEAMTESMYYLLLALRCPGHGYVLMSRVSEISRGRVSMGPGTLYGLLKKMQQAGLVLLDTETQRRKIYSLTAAGESALHGEYSRLQAMVLDGVMLKSPFRHSV